MTELLTRKFGIEMEYDFNERTIKEVHPIITEALAAVPRSRPVALHEEIMTRAERNRLYSDNDEFAKSLYEGDKWHMCYDGAGIEVKTPPSTWENFAEIRAVTEVLRPLGTYSRECGMHVHLSTADFTATDIIRWTALWCSLEEAMFSLVHRHRWSNGWCTSLNTYHEGWNNLRRILLDKSAHNFITQHMGRRAMYPMSAHGTTEIRLHHASLDPIKQKGWLMLLQVLMWHAKNGITDMGIFDTYANQPRVNKIGTLTNLVKEYLPARESTWLTNHIRWRAARYSDLTQEQLDAGTLCAA